MIEDRFPDLSAQRREIEAILKHWNSLAGILIGVISALPLSGLFGKAKDLVPPVFEAVIPVLATIVTLLVLGFLFYTFRRSEEEQLDLWAKILGVFALSCFIFYLILLLVYVENVNSHRIVLGFYLTERAEEAVLNKPDVDSAPKSIAKYFGYESLDQAWELRWATKTLLVFSFIGIFATSAGCFFLFTLGSLAHDDWGNRSHVEDSHSKPKDGTV